MSLDARVFGKGRAYVRDHRDAAFGVVAGERAPDAARASRRRRSVCFVVPVYHDPP